jgi:hypothetical protein
VGNSFGYGPKVRSSVEAGEDIVTFINGWFALFPEYQDRKVIIAGEISAPRAAAKGLIVAAAAGESYGGHYLPAWANAIMDYNEGASADELIHLSGIAIGNGCVNDTVQVSPIAARDSLLRPHRSLLGHRQAGRVPASEQPHPRGSQPAQPGPCERRRAPGSLCVCLRRAIVQGVREPAHGQAPGLHSELLRLPPPGRAVSSLLLIQLHQVELLVPAAYVHPPANVKSPRFLTLPAFLFCLAAMQRT